MKYVSGIAAIAALAGAVAGCASDPYYSRNYYNPSPGYYAPAYYTPSGYNAYPSNYGYKSKWDYYRNYNGSHPGPEASYM